MGCWCETDGVTQLPINWDDKVRCFVLLKQEGESGLGNGGGGVSYSNDIWCPLGPAIKGKYNDYGGVEKITEDLSSEILLEILKSGWVPFEQKYDKVSPIDEMNLEEAIHWIERGEASLELKFRNGANLGIFMVLEKVYQAMITYDPIIADHNRENRTYEYKPRSEVLMGSVKRWYNKLLARSIEMKSDEDNPLKKQLSDLLLELTHLSDGEYSIFDNWRDASLCNFKEKLTECAKSYLPFEDEKVQSLVKIVLEMTAFSSAMAEARKLWTPQCGKGSQSNELAIYKHLNKTIETVIKAAEKEMLKEGADLPNKKGYFSYMLDHNAEVKKNNGSQEVSTKEI